MKMILILASLIVFSGASTFAQQKKQIRHHKHHKHIMKHHVHPKKAKVIKAKEIKMTNNDLKKEK
jgi:hypothetical protein